MRGQISLDIMLAIAIGFIAISSLAVVGNEVTQMQKEAGIRQQLDSIGTGLAQFISSSAILDDADSAMLSFDIPKILVLGETGTQQCDIGIDTVTGRISLSYDIIDLTGGPTKPVSVWKGFAEPTGMDTLPNSIKCGETLTITK